MGFLGMILGWSLQAPVTGIAAWLMLILKRPLKIGQRVIVAGITGDVVDITLTHVILNQVGGAVAGNGRDAVYLFQMPSCSVKQSQIIRLM